MERNGGRWGRKGTGQKGQDGEGVGQGKGREEEDEPPNILPESAPMHLTSLDQTSIDKNQTHSDDDQPTIFIPRRA